MTTITVSYDETLTAAMAIDGPTRIRTGVGGTAEALPVIIDVARSAGADVHMVDTAWLAEPERKLFADAGVTLRLGR